MRSPRKRPGITMRPPMMSVRVSRMMLRIATD